MGTVLDFSIKKPTLLAFCSVLLASSPRAQNNGPVFSGDPIPQPGSQKPSEGTPPPQNNPKPDPSDEGDFVVPATPGNGHSGSVNSGPGFGFGSGEKDIGVLILTPRHLKIELPLPEKAKKDSKVTVLFDFPREKYQFGPLDANVVNDKVYLKLSPTAFKLLSTAQAQSLGEVKLYQDGQELEPSSEDRYPQVFVGGEHDWQCKKPILFSDFDGTLDRPDACTQNNLNAFLVKENASVFVVSTRGALALSSLNRLNFSERKRFAVLDSLSGGFTGTGGGSEKAQRIAVKLFAAGACILGMAGDTATVDGIAAETLDIPFLAVNQRSEPTIVGYKTVTRGFKGCVLRNPVNFELTPQLRKCPAEWEGVPARKIECRSTTFSRRGRPEKRTYYLWEHGTEKCEDQGAQATGNTFNATICSTKLPETAEYIVDQGFFFDSKKCPANYVEKDNTERVNEPVYSGTKPSLDISKFPSGSLYAEDWCEMTRALSEELNRKRSNDK